MVQQILNNLIASLLNEKIIQNIDNGFQCACGSILKRKSIKKHITTNVHTSFFKKAEENEEKAEKAETEKKEIKIVCVCGSKVLRSGMKKHLSTKKHTSFQPVEEKKEDECLICITNKSDFFTCLGCRNKHCWTCHEKLMSPTCPFCRTPFDGENREEQKEEEDYDYENDYYEDDDEENGFNEEEFKEELFRLTVIFRRDRSQISRDRINSLIWTYIDYMPDFMVHNTRIPRWLT
jgi:hypothetical protein